VDDESDIESEGSYSEPTSSQAGDCPPRVLPYTYVSPQAQPEPSSFSESLRNHDDQDLEPHLSAARNAGHRLRLVLSDSDLKVFQGILSPKELMVLRAVAGMAFEVSGATNTSI